VAQASLKQRNDKAMCMKIICVWWRFDEDPLEDHVLVC